MVKILIIELEYLCKIGLLWLCNTFLLFIAILSIYRILLQVISFLMPTNTCSVVFCKFGYKKRKDKKYSTPENNTVFFFPFKNPDLLSLWTKFINRKDWVSGKNGEICSKHFEGKFLKTGKRTTLRWIYTLFPASILILVIFSFSFAFSTPKEKVTNKKRVS